MPKVIAIIRTDRPDRADWIPLDTPKGYQLISRAVSYPDRNWTASAVFVSTLDAAWDLIANHDHGIRMAPPGKKQADYIYPKSLKAVWA